MLETKTPVIRGTRLGRDSLETGSGVELAPRVKQIYFCPNGHDFEIVFHAEADAPTHWVCPTCSTHASLDPDGEPFIAEVKTGKTHWEQVLARRSREDLEALLAEALTNLRTTGKAF